MNAYLMVWKFLKESKNYFFAVILIFAAAILIGFIFPVFFIDFIKKFIEDTANKTAGMGYWQLFIFIFGNNLQAAFIGMMFGIALGIFPLVLAVFNGYVIGFVMNKAVSLGGAGVLWRLLPHGIFEIPALIISFGLGLRLGMFIFKKKGRRKKEFFYSFNNSIKVFIYLVIPLLLIAALIESWLVLVLK